MRAASGLCAIALAGCAASLVPGGKLTSLGVSSDRPVPSASAAASDASGDRDRDLGREARTVPDGDPAPLVSPAPTAPADPWAGVDGDQPRRLAVYEPGGSFDARAPRLPVWYVAHQAGPCTADRDHCLPAESWFAVPDRTDDQPIRVASVVGFAATRMVTPSYRKPGPDEHYDQPLRAASHDNEDVTTAYRTVPATRTNLVAGALVFAYPFPDTAPRSAAEVWSALWTMGVVERVEWDTGMLYFVDGPTPAWISATRVAVMRYRPGGKVEVLGGARRDRLAVARSEVILPE